MLVSQQIINAAEALSRYRQQISLSDEDVSLGCRGKDESNHGSLIERSLALRIV